MGRLLRAVALAFAVSVPAAAAQKSATFHVGAVVRPSVKVSAEVAAEPGAPRIRFAGNAAAPFVRVGNGPQWIATGGEVPLPDSGTVVVTLNY